MKPGGRVANIGVHGQPVTLHLERLWAQNISITTRLVDTISIPQLLTLIAARRFDPTAVRTESCTAEASMLRRLFVKAKSAFRLLVGN